MAKAPFKLERPGLRCFICNCSLEDELFELLIVLSKSRGITLSCGCSGCVSKVQEIIFKKQISVRNLNEIIADLAGDGMPPAAIARSPRNNSPLDR